jgi:hypothetical protein
MIKSIIIIAAILLANSSLVQAQTAGPLQERIEIFSQNSISNIAAIGDTLWVGPLLTRNIGNSFNWQIAENADSVNSGRGRMFSIALAPDTVVVGLGYTASISGTAVQTAQGFYISVDGGSNWRFVPPPLDDENETTIRYGGQDIGVIPIIVPQQSPPFNVAFRNGVLFTAAWASGIRRSTDFGHTWDRILLPPFEISELTPEGNYDFFFDPRAPQAGSPNANRYPQGWQNFLGFSTLIDSDGHVWAGTAGGINISDNALTAPADSVRWRHVRVSGSSNGMLGNWIIRIRQNPHDQTVWLTNWITNPGEIQGLVSTNDKGRTFTRYLIGERINDVGFAGSTIYAAGDTGLFISNDNGQTWVRQPQIRSANSFLKIDPQFRTVASARDNRVWIGSSDGLITTNNAGSSWDIIRVDFPLKGANVFQDNAPDVRTYAYPNPFSRSQHGIVRLRFESEDSSGHINVTLMDFAMNPIRTLQAGAISGVGVYEVAWDGLDRNGVRVANGPVFYHVEAGDRTIHGKLLIVD